jgi:hypothetical protein
MRDKTDLACVIRSRIHNRVLGFMSLLFFSMSLFKGQCLAQLPILPIMMVAAFTGSVRPALLDQMEFFIVPSANFTLFVRPFPGLV